jgi:hypothetical protein
VCPAVVLRVLAEIAFERCLLLLSLLVLSMSGMVDQLARCCVKLVESQSQHTSKAHAVVPPETLYCLMLRQSVVEWLMTSEGVVPCYTYTTKGSAEPANKK